jgi:hypothetical protein
VTTEPPKRKSSGPFIDGCILQGVMMVLAGMILDGGAVFQSTLYAWIAFWGGALVHVARHKGKPTETDLLLMRYGHFFLSVLSYFLTGWIWKLRGY